MARTKRVLAFVATAIVGTLLIAPGKSLAQSGLESNEGMAIGGISGFDTLWADGTYMRWMMNNHSSGTNLPVAAWPCLNTSAGCMVVGASSPPYGEIALTTNSVGGAFLQQVASAHPTWSAYAMPTIAVAGQIMNSSGTSPVTFTSTSTVTLGASGTPGTLGSIAMGNASTSAGLLTWSRWQGLWETRS